MTQETTHRPPIRRTVLDLLAEYGSVTDDLLVAATHAHTDAAPWIIRATIDRMERHGHIYNATGDETRPRWKVTRP